jgi:methylthioxylose transferase
MLDVRAPARSETARAFVAWGGLIVVAVVWGRVLVATGHRLDLAAPPFWSPFEPHLGPAVVPAVVLAALVVRKAPTLAATLPWRRLLGATAVGGAIWAIALAYVDGAHALTEPLTLRKNDYLQTAGGIGSMPAFLSHFVDNIAVYNQHTKGHPPGMVVVEWLLLRIGLASPGWTAALVVAGGAAAAVAALVAMRAVAGEAMARAAAPFMVLVPAVIWWQTADAFFAGVSAWAVTLVVLASGRADPRGDTYALAGGALFGVTAFLSYGLVLLAVLPAVVCGARRRIRPLVIAALGALPVFAVFAAMGFSWFAGFAATRHQYWTGVATHRPYSYFLIADLALFAVAVGPAVAIALPRLRDRNAWLLVGGILTVVACADLSGLSKAEVERIWLPFVPWAMLATGAYASRLRAPALRKLLTLQVVSTLLAAVTVWSQW